MEKLTDAQTKILENAAKDPTKDIKELLSHIRNPQFKTRVLENLAKANMVHETWDGAWLLTNHGLEKFAPLAEIKSVTEKLPVSKDVTKYKGKKGELCRMLSCESGISLSDICKKTGWLEKTIRGTMSIIKKETGFEIERIRDNQDTLYRFKNI